MLSHRSFAAQDMWFLGPFLLIWLLLCLGVCMNAKGQWSWPYACSAFPYYFLQVIQTQQAVLLYSNRWRNCRKWWARKPSWDLGISSESEVTSGPTGNKEKFRLRVFVSVTDLWHVTWLSWIYEKIKVVCNSLNSSHFVFWHLIFLMWFSSVCLCFWFSSVRLEDAA